MPEGTPGSFPVTVTVVEELGSDAFLYGSAADPLEDAVEQAHGADIIARTDPRNPPMKGETVLAQGPRAARSEPSRSRPGSASRS